MVSNKRFTHPAQPNLFVEVVLASRHPITGVVVYTLHLHYPRIIHGEIMTHRVFNRNARSSRAVPILTLLAEIRGSACFIPWHWTGNKSGMQGISNWQESILLKGATALHIDSDTPVSNEAAWLWGRDIMCDLAESFAEAGYHKQIANRLIEPWMWMDLLVTATDWKNFIHLRDHPAAEPHIRDLAVLVGQAIEQAEVQDLEIGQWHLPYITDDDRHNVALFYNFDMATNVTESINSDLCKISAARCARISYAPFDGNATLTKEFERFKMLAESDVVHASPMEHQCCPDRFVTVETTYWNDDDAPNPIKDVSTIGPLNPDLHGPLRGFIQFRKTVPGEAVHG